MLKKIVSALIIVVILVAAVVVIMRLASGLEDTWICQEGAWVKHGNPTEPMPSVICADTNTNNAPSTTSTPENTISESSDESSTSTSDNIVVTKPQADTELELPFSVRGRSRTFEGNVIYEIKELGGKSLIKSCFMGGAYEMRSFDKEIRYLFKKPENTEAVLRVYDENPADGGETSLVTVPFTWADQRLTTVKLFFSKNGANNECQQVFPVELVVARSSTPVRRSLDLLLEGVPCGLNVFSPDYEGLYSNINSGVKVQGLSVDESGVATVDFNERLEEAAGGSCRVAAIRAQITQTMLQFPSVKEVVISINGRTEDILQP